MGQRQEETKTEAYFNMVIRNEKKIDRMVIDMLDN